MAAQHLINTVNNFNVKYSNDSAGQAEVCNELYKNLIFCNKICDAQRIINTIQLYDVYLFIYLFI